MRALDTSAVIRYLTWDDKEKAKEVKEIIESEGVYICGEVILETIYILMSKKHEYRMSKQEVIEFLQDFLTLEKVEIEDEIYLEALELWKSFGKISFADLIVVLKSGREGLSLYSFDEKQKEVFKKLFED